MTECYHTDCDKPGEWEERVVNRDTDEEMDVVVCLEHRNLIWEYDDKNREEMDLPKSEHVPKRADGGEDVDAWETMFTPEFGLYILGFVLLLLVLLFAISILGLTPGWSLLVGLIAGAFFKDYGDWLRDESVERAAGEKR